MRNLFVMFYIGMGLALIYLILNGVGKALSSITPKIIGF